jgi:hypothetical protein
MDAFTFFDTAFLRPPPSGGGSFRVDYRGSARITDGDLTFSADQPCASVPIGPASERDTVYCAVAQELIGTPSSVAATLGATSGTLVQTVLGAGSFGRIARQDLWRFTGVSGDSPLTLTQTNTDTFTTSMHVISWSARDVGSENVVTASANSGTTLDVSQNVAAGDVVIGSLNARDTEPEAFVDGGNCTTVGLTENVDRLIKASEPNNAVVGATHTATGAESPRTITFTVPRIREASALSVRLRA